MNFQDLPSEVRIFELQPVGQTTRDPDIDLGPSAETSFRRSTVVMPRRLLAFDR
jgi:hypothetical protein